MKIYTKQGDAGTTSLFGGKTVPKNSLRIEAYGNVDELNSVIGIVRTLLPQFVLKLGNDGEWYSEMLRRIQNELFDVGSELATPPEGEYEGMHKMGEAEVALLEKEMDRME
ncbi:MAG TPA: ATP:cob(I)alamin adenosyltransferase, partial [Candidatus Kapabacteria bacterium]|nr:ATP:cob(I)alamin adenosyltransferase [Candidatus Kapabacteria bacterium]